MALSKLSGNENMTPGTMTYRQLGETELMLSIVGFGASPSGDVFGAVEPQ